MAELPIPVKAGQPISAAWLNNLAALASGRPTIDGQGYTHGGLTAFATRRSESIRGFGKHTADIAKGAHDPAIEAIEYRSPYYGDISLDNIVSVGYAWGLIPADMLFYWEEIDGVIHAAPMDCAT